MPPAAAPGTFNVDSSSVSVNENAGTVSVGITRSNGSSGAVDLLYSTTDGTAISGVNYTGATGGTVHFDDGQFNGTITLPIIHDNLDTLNKSFSVTLTGAGTGTLGTSLTTTVKIVDTDGAVIATGPLVQNWTDTSLIVDNDNWDNVPNISGYLNDANRDAGIPTVAANQPQSATSGSVGAIAELDGAGVTDPTVAFQATSSVIAPQLILDVNTVGTTGVSFSFDARDLDGTADDAVQPITVSYRIGNSGGFTDIVTVDDVTSGPSLATLVTNIASQLPADALGQQLVQIRIATSRVGGNNEWVGIDNIVVQQTPVLAFAQPTYTVNEGDGTATITVNRTGGTLGAVTVDYSTGDGTAGSSDYTPATGTLHFEDGQTSASFTRADH